MFENTSNLGFIWNIIVVKVSKKKNYSNYKILKKID